VTQRAAVEGLTSKRALDLESNQKNSARGGSRSEAA
jgi:hypothetical protein